nr:immunoglobulin heavy chain junction region [Macaca mulatta]
CAREYEDDYGYYYHYYFDFW